MCVPLLKAPALYFQWKPSLTAYPGYLVRCSFAAEHVFHFRSSPLLAQSLAAIPQDFLREQQTQAKFKTLKAAHERYKDSTQIFASPHASVSE